MSRRVKYNKEMATDLFNEYKNSGKKLKQFCQEKGLKYDSIYAALRRNGVMTYLKKNQTSPVNESKIPETV